MVAKRRIAEIAEPASVSLHNAASSIGGHIMATCRSCDQEIIWALSPAGKRMPMDARPSDQLPPPVPKVLYRLEQGANRQLDAIRWLGDSETDTPTLYASHFSTCPNAAQHSRR